MLRARAIGIASEPREREEREPDRDPIRLVQRAPHRRQMHLDHSGRDHELHADEREGDAHRANDDVQLTALRESDHEAEHVEEEQEGENPMRELHVLRRNRRQQRASAQRKPDARAVRAGNLRREPAEEHRARARSPPQQREPRAARVRHADARVATMPPSPPARSTVAASAASNSAPFNRCATVAAGEFPMRTVTIPSSACSTISAPATSAARSTPPLPPHSRLGALHEGQQHE